jgi:proteasome accessory factor C
VTVAELCERFGYTRRELAEDLQIVFLCGLPGYGPGDLIDADIYEDEVVVRTADYFAGAPRPTPAEALARLAAGSAVIASGQAGPELESAVAKLSAVLLPEDGSQVLDIDLAGEPELVSALRSAAAANEVVEITYTSLSREQTTVRQIEPWRVFSSMGNWYVAAHCRLAGGERLFRIDRIRRITPTGEHFDPPADLPPPEVRYVPSAEDVVCRIALGPQARWVADYYPVEIVSAGPETMVINFSSSDPLVAARLLLRLGGHARLLAGDEVAAALADLRERVLAIYRS